MHLQIRSTVRPTGSGGGPGAQSIDEPRDGVIYAVPGRLIRLLDLLAEDQTEDGDGHGPFNLVAAGGTAIETTGSFVFVVQTDGDDEEQEVAEHEAARKRIGVEFESVLETKKHGEVQHHEGTLRDLLRPEAEQGYLVNDILVGVAKCPNCDGTDESIIVPIQYSVIHATGPVGI